MGRPLSLPEVSERTGVPLDTLRYWRWKAQGDGPKTFKLGRRVVARPEDVEAWIDEQAAKAQVA